MTRIPQELVLLLFYKLWGYGGFLILAFLLRTDAFFSEGAGNEQTTAKVHAKNSITVVLDENSSIPKNTTLLSGTSVLSHGEGNRNSHSGELSGWHTRIHYVMGTLLEVRLPGDESSSLALFSELFAISHQHDQIFSTFLAASPVSRFNRKSNHEPLVVPEELIELANLAQQLTAETQGAFDITVMPLVRLWKNARKNQLWPESESIVAAKRLAGAGGLDINPESLTISKRVDGIELDFGGIAKGYCVDKMAECARQKGVKDAFINFGESSILALGKDAHGNPWEVAVRNPEHPERLALKLKVCNMAIGSSAAYQNQSKIAGRIVGHIVDPRTGLPAPTEIAVTVVAPSAALADALSTALVVLQPDQGMKILEQFPDADAVIFHRTSKGNWQRDCSPGLRRYLNEVGF